MGGRTRESRREEEKERGRERGGKREEGRLILRQRIARKTNMSNCRPCTPIEQSCFFDYITRCVVCERMIT